MQLFRQARTFGPTGCGNRENIDSLKRTINRCLGEISGILTKGRETLIATAYNSSRYFVLILRSAYDIFYRILVLKAWMTLNIVGIMLTIVGTPRLTNIRVQPVS